MALMNVWSFRRFSDSRWISLGSSCRTLLAAVVLGLPDLVDEILANPRASSYFLSGFKHFSDRVARMTATVATCSFVSDSVLAALLDDDRVPSMLPRLVADIKDELAYAMGIDQSVWDFVGRAVGLRGEELRSDSVAASMTSAGFIHRRLREAQGHPGSLCVGDVDRNLDELRREEAPTERVALQIYRLLRIGYSRGAIKQGLALMANCPWSSVCVEQGHVCASMTMRRHKEYSANTMRARSRLLQARPLLSTPPELAQRQRLRNKIAKLDKMKPQHITGRQVFVRELNGLLKDMRRRGRALRPNMHAAVLKGHGERWRAMNPERRRAFETSAEELREERRREIADSRAELVAELEILQARIRRAVASGLPPLRMTSCALTAAQTSSLDALYNSGDFPAARVAELRALAMAPVVEPPQHVRDGLEALDVGEPTRPDRKPQWLGLVCRNRDFFTPTCVRIGQPDACEYWKFVYATKSPLMACFCKLNAVIDEATGAWGPPDYFATSLSHWEHRFQLDTASWVYTDAWPYEADVLVAFLTDCVHLREGVVASDADWLGLDAVRAILPDADAGDGETANADAVAKDKPAWVDHGWLLDFFPTGDCGGAVSQGDRQEGGASCGSQSWRSSADERLEAIDAEEVIPLRASPCFGGRRARSSQGLRVEPSRGCVDSGASRGGLRRVPRGGHPWGAARVPRALWLGPVGELLDSCLRRSGGQRAGQVLVPQAPIPLRRVGREWRRSWLSVSGGASRRVRIAPVRGNVICPNGPSGPTTPRRAARTSANQTVGHHPYIPQPTTALSAPPTLPPPPKKPAPKPYAQIHPSPHP